MWCYKNPKPLNCDTPLTQLWKHEQNNEQNWHLNFLKHIFRSSKFPAPLNNRGQTSLCGQKLVWRYSLLPLATHIHEQEKWLLLWAKTCCCWKCCWHQMELLCWKNNNIFSSIQKVLRRISSLICMKTCCCWNATGTNGVWNVIVVFENLRSQQVPISMINF